MAENWGPGVTRFLPAQARQLLAVVWQDDKPPLDSELNLLQQIDFERTADVIRSQVPSGFLIDPMSSREDYRTDPLYANQFVLGSGAADETAPVLWAAVNGWLLPLTGTAMPEAGGPSGPGNRIRLAPPPTTDSRTDFVFLEVWKSLVSPNPATANKPSAGYLWAYGNTEYGGTNPADDIEDPAVGWETTKRIQLQYRFRVVGSGDAGGTSVDLASYPEGMNDPQVLAQGNAAAPIGGQLFENMRSELGDAGLWRAGDGDPGNALGTVDGYVYAIPVCAVFRRNTAAWTAVDGAGVPNQNGATERTPSSRSLPDPRDGARTLTQAVLAATLTDSTTGYVTLTGLPGSALGDADLFPPGTTRRYLTVGAGIHREIIAINVNPDPVGHPNHIFIDATGRGRGGTQPRRHAAGAPVSLYNTNPDGVYADQISPAQLLDLRHAVNFGDWDYERLLKGSVAALVQNRLRTTFKTSGTGGGTAGPVTAEVSYLQSPAALPSPAPLHVSAVDGPDGIRTIWSDSAALQRGVTVALNPDAPLSNGFTATTFDAGVASSWAVGADFVPRGFLNNLGATGGWTNGTVVFVHLGGTDGASGARRGLVGGQHGVRFVAPSEMWAPGGPRGDDRPWKLRFVGGASGNDAGDGSTPSMNGYRAARITAPAAFGEAVADHPGPMYPDPSTGFERPFLVLGGVLNPSLYLTGIAASADTPGATFTTATPEITLAGVDFDTFSLALGPRGETLRDYLTNYGQDATGNSSRLYLVVYGDKDSKDNNGAFKVVGAGTSGATGGPYTEQLASSGNGLMVRPLSADWVGFTNNPASTVTVEFRSQEITADDDRGSASPPAGVAVVFTDLRGTGLSWGEVDAGLRIHQSGAPAVLTPIGGKAILSTDLLWSPNRGASPRVPDRVVRVAGIGGASTLVRNPVSAVDPSFVSDTGYPDGDRVYEPVQIQLWNRLSSLGYDAPDAPAYGGLVVGLTEQDREAEAFVDPGSKTLLFRPLTLKPMLVKGLNTAASPSLVGPLTYPPGGPSDPPKDAAGVFTTGKTLGYAVPPEYMPRFGRQDIPYHERTGALDPILPGINHLFADSSDATANVFFIIGGENNPGPTGTALVRSMLFATGPLAYGQGGTVGGAPHTAYGARKCHYTDVVSSDLGVGLRGVELPPYHGIARLYGVYERNDFLNNLDPSYIGGFQSDRITPVVGAVSGQSPVNLLRSDASRQTLYIRQGGANAVTGLTHSHTYVVPESALDITAVPGYTGAETFASYDYVVECVVFGFPEGFIDQNNLVLARRSSGTAVTVTDAATLELLNVNMIVPAPAASGDALYQVYERTAYQGDPYMTRGGATVQPADYTARYGQIPQGSAYELATPIEQYDPNTGAVSVSRPNARALRVVASLDFYTTLGTGKVGGRMWAGTPLDCGYTDPVASARIPSSPSAPAWRVLPRAFTEGQQRNRTRAALRVQILDYAHAIAAPRLRFTFTTPSLTAVTTGGVDFGIGATSAAELAGNLADWVNNTSRPLARELAAAATGDTVYFYARTPGGGGNQIRVDLSSATPDPLFPVQTLARVLAPDGGLYPAPFPVPPGGYLTRGYLAGGDDLPVNAGAGDSILSLAGMTERLPLGILVSDSDFLSENILGENATSFSSTASALRAVYRDVPLTGEGYEYTRFLGEPGAAVCLSDGGVLRYTPYSATTPSGSRAYRIYRGGGAAFMLSGVAPGGPLTWAPESFPAALNPVLKGAALACRALLVRNYHEEAFGVASVRTEGDELQLVVLTQAVYGTPRSTSEGVSLAGVISPTGYGEGYAAADRYRVPGMPLDRARARTAPDPDLPPAPPPPANAATTAPTPAPAPAPTPAPAPAPTPAPAPAPTPAPDPDLPPAPYFPRT